MATALATTSGRLPAPSPSAHRRGERALRPLQKWREGGSGGLPKDPTEVLLLWAAEGGREESPETTPGKWSQSVLFPLRTLGEGRGVGRLWASGGRPHSIPSPPSNPSAAWLSVLVFDFAAPKPDLVTRETAVMQCVGSAPRRAAAPGGRPLAHPSRLQDQPPHPAGAWIFAEREGEGRKEGYNLF